MNVRNLYDKSEEKVIVNYENQTGTGTEKIVGNIQSQDFQKRVSDFINNGDTFFELTDKAGKQIILNKEKVIYILLNGEKDSIKYEKSAKKIELYLERISHSLTGVINMKTTKKISNLIENTNFLPFDVKNKDVIKTILINVNKIHQIIDISPKEKSTKEESTNTQSVEKIKKRKVI